MALEDDSRIGYDRILGRYLSEFRRNRFDIVGGSSQISVRIERVYDGVCRIHQIGYGFIPSKRREFLMDDYVERVGPVIILCRSEFALKCRRFEGRRRVSVHSEFVVWVDVRERLSVCSKRSEFFLYVCAQCFETHDYFDLTIKSPISPRNTDRMLASSASAARVRKGFALVHFLAMDLAITKGGIPMPLRFAQSHMADTGGIFPGRLPSWTHVAYCFVFTSFPVSPENVSRYAFLSIPEAPTGVSFLALASRTKTDFLIHAASAVAILIRSILSMVFGIHSMRISMVLFLNEQNTLVSDSDSAFLGDSFDSVECLGYLELVSFPNVNVGRRVERELFSVLVEAHLSVFL